MSKVIVLGGGLAGLSAAHTILQAGNSVVLIDKMMFMGGNSTKATSGINGAGTRVQEKMGIPDSKEQFEEDTVRGGTGRYTGPRPWSWPLSKVISHQSADAIHWLIDAFNLELDTVSRLGGHTHQRTHRKKAGGKFPGFMITYKLMQDFDAIAEAEPNRARFISKGRANKLLTDASGAVIGVQYAKGGKNYTEMGPVVIATGGFGAGGLEPDSFLSKIRPDLMHFPTTNGEHCTGDGIQLAIDAGGYGVGLDDVQIHPTGLINPALPDSRTLFLAAEALRGEGGIIIDREGNRFCNDLGTRNYVTGEMLKHNKAPYRLVLNQKAESGISWHCHHYQGRGVMKAYASGAELAAEMGIPASQLEKSFNHYNAAGKAKKDPWGKKFFPAQPFEMKEKYYVGVITPVCHYTMGGVAMNTKAECIREDGTVIPGLFVAGEASGGVHNLNRLGGSGLLEAVVFGRLAGASANRQAVEGPPGASSSGSAVTISVPQANGSTITVSINSSGVSGAAPASSPAPAPAPAATEAPPADEPQQAGAQGEYDMAEVAKHTTEDDCWLAVDGKVLDVTSFLSDHPGGKMAILTFAGKDASEMFNMVHEEGVIEKFAPECVIGTVKPSAKL
jgi:flavocytochrome c